MEDHQPAPVPLDVAQWMVEQAKQQTKTEALPNEQDIDALIGPVKEPQKWVVHWHSSIDHSTAYCGKVFGPNAEYGERRGEGVRRCAKCDAIKEFLDRQREKR
jgi:NAD-dependent SIR2 family protein deacetylase